MYLWKHNHGQEGKGCSVKTGCSIPYADFKSCVFFKMPEQNSWDLQNNNMVYS